MYRDKSLIPTEAIRMLALGLLETGPKAYADLASEVRHFASRVVGPSLDILGHSIELLRYEGLAETVDALDDGAADSALEENATLRITEAGKAAFRDLLMSNIRAPIDDINKLVVACKMRFLHVLDPDARQTQIDRLVEICETELIRLEDLAAHHLAAHNEGDGGHLVAWLEHDTGQLNARIAWLQDLRDRV